MPLWWLFSVKSVTKYLHFYVNLGELLLLDKLEIGFYLKNWLNWILFYRSLLNLPPSVIYFGCVSNKVLVFLILLVKWRRPWRSAGTSVAKPLQFCNSHVYTLRSTLRLIGEISKGLIVNHWNVKK